MTTTMYGCVYAMLLLSWANIYAAPAKKAPATKAPPAPTMQTVSCPQINATHQHGRIFTQNGRLWHTYIKEGDQMNINTTNDINYGADTTPIAKDIISCHSGSDATPNYAFEAYEPKGMDCTVADRHTFLCQRTK